MKFSNKCAMGCIFPHSNDAGVGEDEMEALCNLVTAALGKGTDCTVNLIACNSMSVFEFEELKDCINDNSNTRVVHYEADCLKVKTKDRNTVTIFMIFGGKNIAKKMGVKKPRESIDSLGSLGSFEDITGQGLTQATRPFYECEVDAAKLKLDELEEVDEYWSD